MSVARDDGAIVSALAVLAISEVTPFMTNLRPSFFTAATSVLRPEPS